MTAAILDSDTAPTRALELSIAKTCAMEGGIVYMPIRNPNKAKVIAEQINTEGRHVHYVYNDAPDSETFHIMVDETMQHSDRFDVLVNSFGTSNPGKCLAFARMDPEVFLDTVQLNLHVYLWPVSQPLNTSLNNAAAVCQHLLRGRRCAGYFSDCLQHQQSGKQPSHQARSPPD